MGLVNFLKPKPDILKKNWRSGELSNDGTFHFRSPKNQTRHGKKEETRNQRMADVKSPQKIESDNERLA